MNIINYSFIIELKKKCSDCQTKKKLCRTFRRGGTEAVGSLVHSDVRQFKDGTLNGTFVGRGFFSGKKVSSRNAELWNFDTVPETWYAEGRQGGPQEEEKEQSMLGPHVSHLTSKRECFLVSRNDESFLIVYHYRYIPMES